MRLQRIATLPAMLAFVACVGIRKLEPAPDASTESAAAERELDPLPDPPPLPSSDVIMTCQAGAIHVLDSMPLWVCEDGLPAFSARVEDSVDTDAEIEAINAGLPGDLEEDFASVLQMQSGHTYVRVRFGDRLQTLIVRGTRSIGGLVAGAKIHYQLKQGSRAGWGLPVSYEVAIHVNDTLAFYAASVTTPEQMQLLPGVSVLRDQVVCRMEVSSNGVRRALRVSSEGGEIVIAPGSAASLGAYDAYVPWTLYDDFRLDATPDTTAFIWVRRTW